MMFAIVLVTAYLFLFFGMSLHPNIFDEGIILTGAMRVAAGQIPHRDFYTNYGPAQFYILAGIFKVFGESLLVARLYDVLVEALVATSVYCIVAFYCRRSIAILTTIATALYLFGLDIKGLAIVPVSLLSLIGSVIISPAFLRPVSTRRMLAGGMIAGAAELFRYDTGLAILGIHACVVAIAISLRIEGGSRRLRAFCSTFWPYLLGFAILSLPPALYYLSVAPLHDFVHDIVVYPAQYYHRERSLPFPPINAKGLDNIIVYLPIAIVAVAAYGVRAQILRMSRHHPLNECNLPEDQSRLGFLVTFGLLALVMYFKGWVRVAPVQMYLSIIPSLLLIALLFQDRFKFLPFMRFSVTCLMGLSLLAPALSGARETRALWKQHASVPEEMLSRTITTKPVTLGWCKIANPLTKGLCFASDGDRIKTIEFILTHTDPNQKLYVGSMRHDKIFANDNLIYFATQRLPATKWSHFDPGLQNSRPVQLEMIHELETNAPPYAVLDSEFDLSQEPNDSSKSTGVTLLDDYLREKYLRVNSFGVFSIWRRM